ncbi:MAG: hypothetical protein ACOCYQ_03515, partial [Alkalispirochaeta sp.]
GILGKTVSTVSLPFDSDGDGRADTVISRALLDTDGDGSYDAIDLDGKPGTPELGLKRRPGEAGVYDVDSDYDGSADFIVTVNGGDHGGVFVLTDSRGRSVDLSGDAGSGMIGIDTDGDGTPNMEATDRLDTALAKEGATFPWPVGRDGGARVEVAVVDGYEGGADTGGLDLDGDGITDFTIISATGPDRTGITSYGVDASGNGNADFYLTSAPGITATSGSGGTGSPVSLLMDGGSRLIGFDADGDGEVDQVVTDPLRGGSDGTPDGDRFTIPSRDLNGKTTESRLTVVGDRPFTITAGSTAITRGLDVDGNGSPDWQLQETKHKGIYAVDTDKDGTADTYLHTFPGAILRSTAEPTAPTATLVDLGHADGVGFDTDGDGLIDDGTVTDEGGVSITDPEPLPTVSISDGNDDPPPATVNRTGTMPLTASLAPAGVAVDRWEWRLNGVVVAGSTGATFTIDPDDPGTSPDGTGITALNPGRYHSVTVLATIDREGRRGVVSAEHIFAVEQ